MTGFLTKAAEKEEQKNGYEVFFSKVGAHPHV